MIAFPVLAGGWQLHAQSFSGKVVDEAGKPLPGVPVDYTRTMRLVANTRGWGPPAVAAEGEPSKAGTVTSGGDGTFSASGLPAGDYIVCVHAPSDSYADPCEWNQGRLMVTVNQTGDTAIGPVTVRAGVRIHLTLSDPQGLIPSGGKVSATVIGVKDPTGRLRRAAPGVRIGNLIDHVITVPHDQIVSLWAFSASVKFLDAAGNQVIPAHASPINFSDGVSDHSVILNVTK